MGAPPNSQVAPLPTNLPFRLISKTIGAGAYASIRKAIPLNAPGPVIAVKFINKEHAFRCGHLKPKQLTIELSLHRHVSGHQNIIRYAGHGDDANWIYLCLELAEGGDLFDKIEADAGVGEDVAHFYFTQLVAAIAWCHGKGVAHRDIKPENMLLSKEGDLKLGDFGLATQCVEPKTGLKKLHTMVCGSPPYIAPEILATGKKVTASKKRAAATVDGDATVKEEVGYDPQIADVWSCAIVMFVLLVGNTPWDSPVLEDSFEFHDYVKSNGRPSDELWDGIPVETLSLIRGMLNVDPAQRFTLETVRKHPWFTRHNPHLNKQGRAANPVNLATEMLESLKINFEAPVQSSQSQSRQLQASQHFHRHHPDAEAMDIDNPSQPGWSRFASTQPETSAADTAFDWEAPPRLGTITASQPNPNDISNRPSTSYDAPPSTASALQDLFTMDPSMSQFSQQPTVPLTLTQAARQFNDIVPAHSLARFLSLLPPARLLPMIRDALHRLSIPVAGADAAPNGDSDRPAQHNIRVKTSDTRSQLLQGVIVLEPIGVGPANYGQQDEVWEVRFVKAKGDPLEWRRLFKQVAVLCKDGIVLPARTGAR